MKNQEGGFLKLIIIVAVVLVLFMYHDKDGVTPAQKVIHKFEDVYNGLIGKAQTAKSQIEEHDRQIQEVQKSLEQ